MGPGAVFAEISDGKGALARMGAVVELVKSWRFGKDTPIGQLAAAINHQGVNAGLPEAEVFQNVLAAFDSAETNADKSLQSASLHTAGLVELQKGVFTSKATDEQKREREIFSRTGLTAPVRSWLNRELEGYAGVLSECQSSVSGGHNEGAVGKPASKALALSLGLSCACRAAAWRNERTGRE